MFKQEFILQVWRFALVGGVVTIFFMSLNWLLAPLLGEVGAYFVAYPWPVILHFCLNKWWTFRDQRAVEVFQVSKYLGMTLLAFVIQTAIFKLLLAFTEMPSWLASGLASAGQVVIAFLVLRAWVFGASKKTPRANELG